MTRALVLSGGGPVGIAWQTGLAAALKECGLDLADADWILGTSAGSSVGASLARGRDMAAVRQRYRDRGEARPAAGAGPDRIGSGDRAGGPPNLAKLIELMGKSAAHEGPPEEARAEIGAYALAAETAPEEAFLAGFAHLDEEGGWPDRYQCTAVDALDGSFVVWDGSQRPEVPLSHAVASSCAVPGIFPPITINGRRYIDGGMRSGTSADLAKGHDKVLIVTMTNPARAAAMADNPRFARMAKRSAEEQAILTESGAAIESVGPDEEGAAAIGMNYMDSRVAVAAGEHGYRQGRLEADRLRGFWTA